MRVRVVVPKPGMVMATMPSRSSPTRSKAARRDQQRQRGIQPAGKPMVTFCAPMWRSRFASAVDWMSKISRQCSARRSASAGTKGVRCRAGRSSSIALASGPPARRANRTRWCENCVLRCEAEKVLLRRSLVLPSLHVDVAHYHLRVEVEALRLGQNRCRSRRSANARPTPDRWSIRRRRPRRRDRRPDSAPIAGAPGRGDSRPCPAVRCWPRGSGRIVAPARAMSPAGRVAPPTGLRRSRRQ